MAEEQSNNPTQGGWSYADGVQGEGDRPSYLMDKFKSVADQAASYTELEKRFGGFNGAPENYTFGEGVDANDPRVNGLVELARNANMNNDLLNSILELDKNGREERLAKYREEQLKALGDNAETRLNVLNDWSKNNIPPELTDTFKDISTNAKAVQLMEHFMNSTKAQAPADGKAPLNQGITKAQLDELQFAEDKHGNRLISVDQAKRKEFNDLYAKYKAQT